MVAYSRIINEAKHNHGASFETIQRAIDLRKKMTGCEKILWEKLRKRKLNNKYFRRQHPYGIYILDFFCFETNLAIEIDGKVHDYHGNYDCERTRYLESSGLKVIRFRNEDIETRIEWVIKVISKYTG